MSRNLAQTDCYFCHGEVKLTGEKRQVVKDDCGVYFAEYEGMIVADAECGDCEAKYLAWVDESKRVCYRRTPDPARLFEDLSFRSTFNDEPGEEDMPKYKIRETITRERIGAFVTGHPWPYLEKGEARTTSDITAIEQERIEMAEQRRAHADLLTAGVQATIERDALRRDLDQELSAHAQTIAQAEVDSLANSRAVSTCLRERDKARDKIAELEIAIDNIYKRRIAELEAALRGCREAMRVQDGRESGAMHITAGTMTHIWDEAERNADAALSPAPAQEKKSDG